MPVLLAINAAMPWLLPASAAVAVTRKLLPTGRPDQAEKLPLSKPSAKMRSAWAGGVKVGVGVLLGTAVGV